jgi:acyl carrier protein
MQPENQTIRDVIVELIAEQLLLNPQELETRIESAGDLTFEQLGVDVLEKYELFMNIEETFTCEISDEEADMLNTVVQLVQFIEQCKLQDIE